MLRLSPDSMLMRLSVCYNKAKSEQHFHKRNEGYYDKKTNTTITALDYDYHSYNFLRHGRTWLQNV